MNLGLTWINREMLADEAGTDRLHPVAVGTVTRRPTPSGRPENIMRQLLLVALVGGLVGGPGNGDRAGAADPPDPAKQLIELLKHSENSFVREKAAAALRAMGEKAVDPLAGAFEQSWHQSKFQEFAKAAATILGEIGPDAARSAEAIVKAVDSAEVIENRVPYKTQPVREAAIEALGKIFKRPSDRRANAHAAAADAVIKAMRAAEKLETAVTAVKEKKNRPEQIKKAQEAAKKAAGEAAKAADEAAKAAAEWYLGDQEAAKNSARPLLRAVLKLESAATSAKDSASKLIMDEKAVEGAKKATSELIEAATDLVGWRLPVAESASKEDAIRALTTALQTPDGTTVDEKFAAAKIKILAAEALGRIYGKAESGKAE